MALMTEYTNTHMHRQIHKQSSKETLAEVIFCFFSWSWTCVTVYTVIYCKSLNKEYTPTSSVLSSPGLFMDLPRALFGNVHMLCVPITNHLILKRLSVTETDDK